MAAIESDWDTNVETIQEWWNLVHPHAVRLEKLITPSPETVTEEHVSSMRGTLRKLHLQVQELPYPAEAAPLREALLKATKQLYLCYRDAVQTSEEAEFYYYNALTQLAQLHHMLVTHGFAN